MLRRSNLEDLIQSGPNRLVIKEAVNPLTSEVSIGEQKRRDMLVEGFQELLCALRGLVNNVQLEDELQAMQENVHNYCDYPYVVQKRPYVYAIAIETLQSLFACERAKSDLCTSLSPELVKTMELGINSLNNLEIDANQAMMINQILATLSGKLTPIPFTIALIRAAINGAVS